MSLSVTASSIIDDAKVAKRVRDKSGCVCDFVLLSFVTSMLSNVDVFAYPF